MLHPNQLVKEHMNIIKKKAFNEKMSLKKRYPNHQNLANGGVVKRFADGGIANNDTSVGKANASPWGNGGDTNIGSLSGALGLSNNFKASGADLHNGTNDTQLNNAYTGSQNALNAQIGLANTFVPQAKQAVGEQNLLSTQYQNMINGTGPNPAQAQLAQATQGNVANQSAMAAGQRGAAGNVGLIERQAAQQGSAAQQQAAGQAATLQAQQQISAQQNLANLAEQQTGQAVGTVTGLNSSQQNEQNILQGANSSYNGAAAGIQESINAANAQTAAANTAMTGNIISGIGGGLAGGLFAHGGKVADGPHRSHVANFLHGGKTKGVKSLVSANEVYLNPDQVKSVVEHDADPMKIGHKFKGKDVVKGKDSYKNDVIPAELEEGGVVVPLHVTQHKKASEKSRTFVKRAVAKHMKSPRR